MNYFSTKWTKKQKGHIIPGPKEMTSREEPGFLTSPDLNILTSRGNLAIAKIAREQLKQITNIDLPVIEVDCAEDAILICRESVIPASAAEKIRIELNRLKDRGLKTEAYWLEITESAMSMAGLDASGLFYAIQSLLQLINNNKNGRVPSLKIIDWPDHSVRGVHLCLQLPHLAEERIDLDYLKRLIRWLLAAYKLNTLVLEIDASVMYERHPELSRKGALSKDELGEIVEFAKAHFIGVVPNVQSLGHQDEFLLRAYPELAEQGSNTYCPSNPKVFDIFYDVYEEMSELFIPKYFHIGHDEIDAIGKCNKCKQVPNYRIFADNINRICEFLLAKNIRSMVWSDMLLPDGFEFKDACNADKYNTAKSIDLLRRDVVICDWSYGGSKEYPSIDFFQQKGFDVLGSPWYKLENISCFSRYAKSRNVLGMLGTTWTGVTLTPQHGDRAETSNLKSRDEIVDGIVMQGEYFWKSI